ncbi:efflux RND transporter periplasmic adaptor subunit [Paraburkholderia terricola]|uniref:RND family efflux transporter, MFP subunit n=1 Tax=Paraburkholderia terricola TaxID=169427 RepID=A0A1M6VV42_9BURK|nr:MULTISPECIES: efflux RND transporter periplasmic adaptor subunit [Paraburkholderia]SDP10197.1 RND family efflux transporter, MFP subunit [Paraburkholderia sediminicola]SHK85225.1 RND family efflux transporter, MFP subunit [Paraburkholderia terricola]
MLRTRKRILIAAAVAVVILVIAIVQAIRKRGAPAATATVSSVVEFAPDDLTTVSRRTLSETLPLTGSLRAVTQAAVKSKVAGSALEVLVREGDAVKTGQILAKIDARDYVARAEQSRGQMAAMAGQLDIARQTLDNNRVLVEKGFISKNAFDTAQSQYEIARANLDAARAALASSNLSLADTVVRSPLDGQIATRSVEPGEKVAVDTKLFDVVDLRTLELEAPVPVGEIGRVRIGQPVRIAFDGIETPVQGAITRINPAAQAGSRSIMVYVQVANPSGTLRVGMFGTGTIAVGSRPNALVVPVTAVRTDGARRSVYALIDGKLVEQPVRTGVSGVSNDGEGAAWTEIVGGPLAVGQQIVKNNLGSLRIGSTVRVVQPAKPALPAQTAPPAAGASGASSPR